MPVGASLTALTVMLMVSLSEAPSKLVMVSEVAPVKLRSGVKVNPSRAALIAVRRPWKVIVALPLAPL